MKILLVCAGGMSTGLLMKKMEAYWQEQGVELSIKATGIGGYEKYAQEYDIIMVGPQVRYKLKEITETTAIPCGVIAPLDYGMQNCENIMKLAHTLYAQRENRL